MIAQTTVCKLRVFGHSSIIAIYFNTILHYIILHYITLHYIILYYIILYYIILYYIILYYIMFQTVLTKMFTAGFISCY